MAADVLSSPSLQTPREAAGDKRHTDLTLEKAGLKACMP